MIIMKLKKWYVENCYYKNKAQRRIVAASRYYHKGGVFRIYGLLMHQRNLKLFPCEIYPYVKIGENFFLPHSIGVVIGQTAEIGNNVSVYPNVVIGGKHFTRVPEYGVRRHAIIGDNCLIGANAVVLGPVTIGRNVIIAAGAVVDKDIPDNSLVFGHNIIREKQVPVSDTGSGK